MSISTSEKIGEKRFGRNMRALTVEEILIVRIIDVPYLVCSLSAPTTRKGFSFSKELIFTELLADARAKRSQRLI
jgi:hypothetical protein